jgi:16S rRNA (guanine1207-N2)-methyltransferase
MINTTIKNIPLQFHTDSTVFSPAGIDRGTLAMLSQVDFTPGDRVLDLGCGYGAVGLTAAKIIGEDKVILCDISEDAVALARQNALLNGLSHADIRQSDAYENIPEQDFTLILSNPPYHTDFSVARRFIETGFYKLAPGGKMVMVTKRLDWYKNKLTSVFGGVRIRETDGYYVFLSEKRQDAPHSKKKSKPNPGLSKKLQRKYKGPR